MDKDLMFRVWPDAVDALERVVAYLAEEKANFEASGSPDDHIWNAVQELDALAYSCRRRMWATIKLYERHIDDPKLTKDLMFRACMSEVNEMDEDEMDEFEINEMDEGDLK